MPSYTKKHRRTGRQPTEQRNPASRNLDRMTAVEIVRLMNREDRKVALAVGREIPAIARAVDAIARGIQNGGRVIYVGAGSSGRMAVLDAAECPPTFGTSPKLM
jgi:N-acetylmuramic acid 6-phosphate etherase